MQRVYLNSVAIKGVPQGKLETPENLNGSWDASVVRQGRCLAKNILWQQALEWPHVKERLVSRRNDPEILDMVIVANVPLQILESLTPKSFGVSFLKLLFGKIGHVPAHIDLVLWTSFQKTSECAGHEGVSQMASLRWYAT